MTKVFLEQALDLPRSAKNSSVEDGQLTVLRTKNSGIISQSYSRQQLTVKPQPFYSSSIDIVDIALPQPVLKKARL